MITLTAPKTLTPIGFTQPAPPPPPPRVFTPPPVTIPAGPLAPPYVTVDNPGTSLAWLPNPQRPRQQILIMGDGVQTSDGTPLSIPYNPNWADADVEAAIKAVLGA